MKTKKGIFKMSALEIAMAAVAFVLWGTVLLQVLEVIL